MTAFAFNSKQIVFYELLFFFYSRVMVTRSKTWLSNKPQTIEPGTQAWSFPSMNLNVCFPAWGSWFSCSSGDLGAGPLPPGPRPAPLWSSPCFRPAGLVLVEWMPGLLPPLLSQGDPAGWKLKHLPSCFLPGLPSQARVSVGMHLAPGLCHHSPQLLLLVTCMVTHRQLQGQEQVQNVPCHILRAFVNTQQADSKPSMDV